MSPAAKKPVKPKAEKTETKAGDSKLNVVDVQGKVVGHLSLDPVWQEPVKTGVLSQAIAMYRTNLRAGTASTKTRGDVSGGGKKPFKQKHTGRARAGSTRSPLWRHGGVVFGPHPRNMHYRLPQSIRRVALLESLKGKLRDAQLIVIGEFQTDAPKTKTFAGLAKTFSVARRSLIVLEQPTEAVVKSLRNLGAFELSHAANINAFDVLNADKILLTKAAFGRLEQRVKESDASSN